MKKEKDPAFLFYSQDFFTGTATMTWEDRGKYITLLCVMHQKGRLPEKSICFLVGDVSQELREKFKVDENGLWYNERLELEAGKRAAYSQSRRNNASGSKITDKHKPEHIPKHMPPHKEDENENENEGKDNIKKTEPQSGLFPDAEYQKPSDFISQHLSIYLEQLNMKSGLSPQDFTFCMGQWSLTVEKDGWEYSGDQFKDLKMLRAGFEKWLNTWSRNDRNKPVGKTGKPGMADHLLINQRAKDGIQ